MISASQLTSDRPRRSTRPTPITSVARAGAMKSSVIDTPSGRPVDGVGERPGSACGLGAPPLAGQVVCEVGSGLNGKRPTLRRVLSDPDAKVIFVEHRDRLARFGVEHLKAALSAQGRRIVVADPGETTDDPVRDMIEVLTSMCARLYGRRGARNRAMGALRAAKRDPGAAA